MVIFARKTEASCLTVAYLTDRIKENACAVLPGWSFSVDSRHPEPKLPNRLSITIFLTFSESHSLFIWDRTKLVVAYFSQIHAGVFHRIIDHFSADLQTDKDMYLSRRKNLSKFSENSLRRTNRLTYISLFQIHLFNNNCKTTKHHKI